jgi:uncharacterized damage-inducible protein DinB
MHLYMQAYDEILNNLLERMDGIFSELPVEALDWTPDPAMNSITVLVVHVTGALRYWLGELLGGEDAHRDRETEFSAYGLSKTQLHTLLNETQAQISRVLEKIAPDDLASKHYSSIHKDYFTGAFALAHVVEHTALHVGHMEITKELWEQYDWGRKD